MDDLLAAGLLRKVRGIVGQTMEIRILDSGGCALGRHYVQWIGGAMFQAGSYWCLHRFPCSSRRLLGFLKDLCTKK